MDYQQLLLNFLTIVISLIAFYLFKSYWPKYFESKGANQALREDIGEITEIVEKIKSDLSNQNELLKAQLSYNNQHKLNIKSAEREALFDFNKRVSAWLYSLMRFAFSGYDFDNYKEIKLLSVEFSKRQYECDLADAHLVLFMHDKEFMELKRDLSISIIELEQIVGNAILKFHWIYSNCELILEPVKNDSAKKLEIHQQLYKDVQALAEKHIKERLTQYKKVNDLQVKMTHLINTRLKQLEEDEKNIS